MPTAWDHNKVIIMASRMHSHRAAYNSFICVIVKLVQRKSY